MSGHLQWGVVRPEGAHASIALRTGDRALLLRTAADEGLLGRDVDLRHAVSAPVLNSLIELGHDAWHAVEQRAHELIDGGHQLLPLAFCEPLLPVRITDYVDFYASLEHVENFGRLWRPGQSAVHENWRHLPVGYHGRASTVFVSGTPIRRPRGQVAAGEVAPTRALDLECEVGFVCGPSARGPIPIDRASEHIFGVVLVNDWSARDIQRFEYIPLGPFLGKSFATSMSAWITPLGAVPKVAPREQDFAPAEYLRAAEPWALDIALEIEVAGEVLSHPRSSWLYWTPAQMLAHMTVNGAQLSAGDLFASGTVSGSEPGTEGSLGEITRGERWLADGDEVVLRGRAGGIELGEVRGQILTNE